MSILSSNIMTFAMQPIKRMDVEAARDDLNKRTLVHLGYDFARLIYLCSLRDFSTGAYHHHGLVNSFSEFAATAAITSWHEEVFLRLTLGPLDSLVSQIDRFVRTSARDYQVTVATWQTLETYHILVPSSADPFMTELFRSNVKIAMQLLKSPRPLPPPELPRTSRRPSPDR
jgi:hypothetical protein